MALQTFSLDAVQKVSQHIRKKLVLPLSEQQPAADNNGAIAGEPPEPDSLDTLGDLFRAGSFAEETIPAPNSEGRWFISTMDPAAVLYKLPGLSIKPGIRLVTYLQRRPEGGLGVTWALPELLSTTAHLEAALEDIGSSTPPHPKGALGHVMDGIVGNGSPASYIATSLLIREFKELGRTGNLRRWSQHRLIDRVPSRQTWQWRSKVPQDLSPKVKVLEDESVLVEFFSCRVVAPVALFRHLDQYHRGGYRPKPNDQVIALMEATAVPTEMAS
ncbi:hypothetical protein [Leptolyngbya sp. PCC 6406]|uniref:hypothetical protein n=1 Tax=Leptolyngbya sp. PCC 6406 TaxID=1173264 RepID=UPI0002AC3F91|nr:hypothetical protein [Leptolyngbya sp. PCC 6406]